jgi:hypothetical protein
MNLREQLRHILPEFLPSSPSDAVKGTDLIRLVRLRLGDEYSDATLRYHFSILSYDPTSPIAKVDQGQGYYQRRKKLNGSPGGSGRGGLFEPDSPEMDAARLRFQRVTAIYERLSLLRGSFPFLLNGRNGNSPHLNGEWEVPDFVTADWDIDPASDDEVRFDQSMIDLRRHVGGPEVNLTGVQLKLGVTLESFSGDFFQALSATRWAIQGELVIAETLSDEALVDSLRNLGHQFGLGITSLGIDPGRLDELPSPDELLAMSAAEFEAVHSLLQIQKITLATQRHTLDWAAFSSLRKKHESVAELTRWLSDCLEKRAPVKL